MCDALQGTIAVSHDHDIFDVVLQIPGAAERIGYNGTLTVCVRPAIALKLAEEIVANARQAQREDLENSLFPPPAVTL